MTSRAETLLTTLRDWLGAVPGVKTSRIGLEAGMSPDDYPIVRIVPSKLAADGVIGRRSIEALIYFGQPVDEADGLQQVYGQWLTMEEALIAACGNCPGLACLHHETILDEDRVAGFKMLALRVTVRG